MQLHNLFLTCFSVIMRTMTKLPENPTMSLQLQKEVQFSTFEFGLLIIRCGKART